MLVHIYHNTLYCKIYKWYLFRINAKIKTDWSNLWHGMYVEGPFSAVINVYCDWWSKIIKPWRNLLTKDMEMEAM